MSWDELGCVGMRLDGFGWVGLRNAFWVESSAVFAPLETCITWPHRPMVANDASHAGEERQRSAERLVAKIGIDGSTFQKRRMLAE